MHHSLPVIQIPIFWYICNIVVRAISIWDGSTCVVVGGNSGAVCKMCGSEVLFHPALYANLHGGIHVAVIIGERGCAYTRESIVVF